MTRKIGETFFTIDGKEMIVVKNNDGCDNCDFSNRDVIMSSCWDNKDVLGNCNGVSFKLKKSFKFLK